MTKCQHTLEMPEMVWDAVAEHWTTPPDGGLIITTHVCGLQSQHVNSPERERRKHLCRTCSLVWVALDHNPFAREDER